jgi:MFS family permease
MLFGTVAGSLADTLGRKRGALAYVVVYAASCVTKHWRSYEVLMFGRVLGGIATSLLFSVFDSWLVAEHASRGFEPAWLSTTFANAQAGNSIVAILSGVLGEWIAGTTPMRVLVAGSTGGEDAAPDGAIMWGGYCLPFDAAAVFLLVGGFVIMTTWNENYGDTKQSSGADGLRESLTKGLLLLARDRRVLLVLRGGHVRLRLRVDAGAHGGERAAVRDSAFYWNFNVTRSRRWRLHESLRVSWIYMRHTGRRTARSSRR